MSKGVYIHIPFCSRKCNYCSFYSVADLKYKGEFLAALEKEMEYKKRAYPEFFDNSEATLYIGGGNPCLLDETEIARLFELLRNLPFRFTETTIEANPDSITAAKAGLYKKLGINRISVGVQAFDDLILKFLGRNHTVSGALHALDIVSKHFDNFSIDLIGGIPIGSQFPSQCPAEKSGVQSSERKPIGLDSGSKDCRNDDNMSLRPSLVLSFQPSSLKSFSDPQSTVHSLLPRDWETEFRYISQYRPPHLSFYLLSIEKGSEFYGKVRTDEDEQGRDYELFCADMLDMDYEHYEISNFCRPGYSCRHNEAYWERNEYMGFGPSAASFLKEAEEEMRIKNASNIHSYIKVPALSELEILSKEDSFFETVFLSLRTNKGLDTAYLESRFPGRTAGIEEGLLRLGKSGFVEKFNGRWIIPEKHLIINNEIVVELMKETEYA